MQSTLFPLLSTLLLHALLWTAAALLVLRRIRLSERRVLFVQPLVALVRRRLPAESDSAADARAVARTRGPLALARCLATVAGWQDSGRGSAAALAPGMAPSRSALVRRVERLLAPAGPAPSRAGRAAFGGGVALALVAFACGAPGVDDSLTDREDGDLGESRVAVIDPSFGRDSGRAAGPEPALRVELAADGEAALWRGDESLGTFALDQGEGDARAGLDAFRRALEAAAGDLPRVADLGGTAADGPLASQLVAGRFRIEVGEDTPYAYVQRVMQLCGTKDVLLWDLVLVNADAPGMRYRVPLPVDIGVHVEEREAVEGEAGEPRATWRIELVVTSGSWRDDGSATVAGPSLATGPDGARLDPRQQRTTASTDAGELERYLRSLYEGVGNLPVVIDARPGVTYAPVRDVLDGVFAAGFTDLRFTGEYR